MAINRADIAVFTYFLALAKHRNFRAAGTELGISASALSHALKGLEDRLGVRLLNRTSRSVTLTAAGEELLASISGPFDAIEQARDALNRFRDVPAGRIRLNVLDDAAVLLLAPIMPGFAELYPDIHLDIESNDRLVDVIGEGFDAGIRHGGTVPEDMIAQRLSKDLGWIVVGSPAYLERHGTPQTPDDLSHHRCIGYRLGNDRIYNWEFMGPDGEFAVPMREGLIVNGARANLAFALSGSGLIYAAEPVLAPYIARGELRQVLTDWSTTGAGYQIYYSSRRQVPTALKVLIEHIRKIRPLGL
ncbi:LysR family transcriptional regulator [Novosphingobium terrae]|uniref:LysR family transcriptional regulator n=1 Tax=Novosphingobium terrae TaxID=2726189 RepID=UPI00197FDF9D|nr:LysR family transcriptional regulator [Novosphingobium terrae]